MSWPKGPQSAKQKANSGAALKKFYQEHPGKHIRDRNTPEAYALIQRYGFPLIHCLRRKYNGLYSRCNNPNDISYPDYGGRGIENRFTSPLHFLNYVIFEMRITTIEQIEGLEIDRIDNDGDYENRNIRFVTHQQNCNNRRKCT